MRKEHGPLHSNHFLQLLEADAADKVNLFTPRMGLLHAALTAAYSLDKPLESHNRAVNKQGRRQRSP